MGGGFGPSEVVDLFFDSEQEGSATSDPSGGLSAQLQIPKSATPGTHAVSATGQLSGLTASAPFTVRTDWPMFHFHPAHDGLNPFENVLSAQNVASLRLSWTFKGAGFFRAEPAVARGIVFVGSGDSLYAVNASTGTRLWKWTDRLACCVGAPAVWHGRVYFSTDRGSVYVLDAATGGRKWTYSTGDWVTDITIATGVVYVGSLNGSVYALDAQTGHKLWSTYTGLAVSAAPAVASGVVYAGAWDTKLYALDARTGVILWTGDTGDLIESSPAVANGLVYVGSDDDSLYAFPAAGCGLPACSPVWTFTSGSWVQSSPALAYGMVFVGSDDHNIYALDAATGAVRWTVVTGDQITRGSAAIANGLVYIGSLDHVLRAIDAVSGQVLWTYTMGDSDNAPPVVVNGWVYSGSYDQHFYAFHLPG